MADEPSPPETPAPEPEAAANDAFSAFPAFPSAATAGATVKPARPPGLTPERLAAEVRRFDRIIVLLVLVWAFFLASFVARNSDVWLHLAAGRALAQGTYVFGADPFSYTTAGVYWVNHSWLFDLGLYGLLEAGGGADSPFARGLLVGFKALLITLLAGVLLAIRRRDQSIWLPAVLVGLTVLVLSPRLLLQSVCVSYLFLGLTLWLLFREGKPQPGPETKGWRLLFTTSPARLYTVPVLFALWVNLDSWFVVGPVVLALFLLGELLQTLSPLRPGPDAPAPGELRALTVALGLGLVACLLSPHHYHAFAVPVDLYPAVQLGTLKRDPGFIALFYNPVSSSYFTPGVGSNVAGYTYFGLLAISLFSFGLTPQPRFGRILLWLTFALLGALHVRLLPFFAVIAGPVAVLNIQDFVVRRLGTALPESHGGRVWSLGGRLATILLLIGLLWAAWPGWLGPSANSPLLARRVAWGVDVDPSLRKAAEQLGAWRRQGLLPAEARGFNFIPDVANYCAWFGPEEKGFFDYRYPLQAGAAADYVGVRKTLQPRGEPGETVWQRVFRDRGIGYVILNGGNLEPFLDPMLRDAQQWTPLYLDGRTAVLAWHDPKQQPGPPVPAALRLDLDRRAFGPDAERAPSEGPGRPPGQRDWWTRWAKAPPRHSLDADEALMDLLVYKALLARWQQERLQAWVLNTTAGCVAVAAGDPGPAATATALTLRFGSVLDERLSRALFSTYLQAFDPGPPAAPLLAVRAGRRAVASTPDDASAYLNLARAVHILWRNQENAWSRTSPPRFDLRQIGQLRQVIAQRPQALGSVLSPWVTRAVSPRQLLRQVQLVWALQQALALDTPDAQQAHDMLFETYLQMGYFDLALEHLREGTKRLKAAGPSAPDFTKQFAEQVQQREQLTELFDKELKNLQADFELQAAGLPMEAKGRLAFEPFCLAKQAIVLLEAADPKAFDRPTADLLVYLLLTTGQANKLRGDTGVRLGVLAPNLQAVLGARYDVQQTFLAAAVGDYAQAGRSLEQVLPLTRGAAVPALAPLLLGLTFDQLQTPLLARVTLAGFVVPQAAQAHVAMLTALNQEAELQTLRGLLALEEGDVKTAEQFFRAALKAAGPNVNFESRPIVKRYLQLIEEARGQRRAPTTP